MGKAEIYKELAEKDMLTKCYNRNAYNEQSKNVHMQIASGYAQFDAGMDMDLDKRWLELHGIAGELENYFVWNVHKQFPS